MPAIASEFLAIDRKARARIPSLDVATRPVSERVCDFNDVVIPMDADQAMLEAARCVHCPDPAPCLEAFVPCYERQVGGIEIPRGQPTGRKVAIVGAGPSGMACADQLIQRGHTVTIFDSKPAPGGLLTYGIPNFKLPKEVVFERWGDLDRAGVEFVSETYIVKDKTIDDLITEGYEAVFLGVGVGVDAPMEVPGEELPGVMKATEFLIRCFLH